MFFVGKSNIVHHHEHLHPHRYFGRDKKQVDVGMDGAKYRKIFDVIICERLETEVDF